jgi:hypothetical protein
VLRLNAVAPHLVALEATGGFETVVAASLAAAKLPLVVVTRRKSAPLPRRSASRQKPEPGGGFSSARESCPATGNDPASAAYGVYPARTSAGRAKSPGAASFTGMPVAAERQIASSAAILPSFSSSVNG